MNKNLIIAGMLAAVLVLALAGCATTGSGDPGTAPTLSEFISTNEGNSIKGQWISQTSFGVNEGIGVSVKAYDREADIRKFAITMKRDGTEVAFWEPTIKGAGQNYTQNFSTWNFSAGEYMAEIYATDAKGNKSNTMTTAFTVK